MRRKTTMQTRSGRVLGTALCASLIWAITLSDGLAARQTPVPRIVASPALKTKANTQVSSIRTGAGQYDQAIAAIARLATVPVSTQAQVKALMTTLDANVKIVQDRLNDRLMLIALSDATFKQSVEAAVRQQGGKTVVADVRTRGIDRIGGISGVQTALTRRVQEDAQTLKRTAEALAAKSQRTASPSSPAPGCAADDAAQTPIPPHTSFEIPVNVIVATVIQLIAIIADNAANPPDDTPPPPPPASSLTRCLADVDAATRRCVTDAGLNPLKLLDCAAKKIVGVATCLAGR